MFEIIPPMLLGQITGAAITFLIGYPLLERMLKKRDPEGFRKNKYFLRVFFFLGFLVAAFW